MERAFRDTYGLELKDQFLSLDLALGTYRKTVSSFIPTATRIAWSLKKDEIVQARPGMTKRKFLYNLRRSAFEKEWGKDYRRPGWFARFLAAILRVFPEVGPFKSLNVKAPTPQTETLFMNSFNATLDLYRKLLREQAGGKSSLANMDFDTGKPTTQGEYSLADETYSKLLRDHSKNGFSAVTPELRANLLRFYSSPKLKAAPGKKPKKSDAADEAAILAAVEKLRALDQTGPPAPLP